MPPDDVRPCDACREPRPASPHVRVLRRGRRHLETIPNWLCGPCVERFRAMGMDLEQRDR